MLQYPSLFPLPRYRNQQSRKSMQQRARLVTSRIKSVDNHPSHSLSAPRFSFFFFYFFSIFSSSMPQIVSLCVVGDVGSASIPSTTNQQNNKGCLIATL